MVLGSALGFSTKPIIRPSPSTSMMPKSLASSTGTGMAATVRSALLVEVEVEHLPHVHPVDVVGAEDEGVLRLLVGDDVEVLVDGVGGALEPLAARSASGPGRSPTYWLRKAESRQAALHVGVERLRLVLHQHLDLEDAGVGEVGEDEVDDAVAAAEGDGRLGPVAGERVEPPPFAAGQDHRQELRHVVTPPRGAWPELKAGRRGEAAARGRARRFGPHVSAGPQHRPVRRLVRQQPALHAPARRRSRRAGRPPPPPGGTAPGWPPGSDRWPPPPPGPPRACPAGRPARRRCACSPKGMASRARQTMSWNGLPRRSRAGSWGARPAK